jgi:hypothetical protein
MEPHVIAIRHLELLSEAERRQRDARSARIFSRMRTARRRSADR